MSKKLSCILFFIIFTFCIPLAFAGNYARNLCNHPGFTCYRVQKHDTWSTLFPDPTTRRLVMRVNRMNTNIYRGMIIAIPKNVNYIDHMDVSPFPLRINPPGRKILYINMSFHAFGAYDKYGYLQHWGPVSGGKGYCPDVHRRCNTPRGNFYVYSKGLAGCISKKYPVGEGGAPMPYCMFFHGGYAMHASVLPGYHASHGCVRMFYEDAQWLNRNFVEHGTKVIIR